MSQVFSHSPLSLQLASVPAFMSLGEEQIADIAARGAILDVDGARYHVAPMGKSNEIPRVTPDLQPESLSRSSADAAASLARLLFLRLGILASSTRNGTLIQAHSEACRLSGATGGVEPQVVFYGFHSRRTQSRSAFMHLFPKGKPLLLDTLNTRLGISFAAQRGKAADALNIIAGPPVFPSGSTLHSWHMFLQNHMAKINPFAIIAAKADAGMTAESPWLNRFAYNNLTGKERDEYFALPSAQEKLLEYARAMAAGHSPPVLEQDMQCLIDYMTARMMMRAICKLGLHFFQEQNIPVVFHWTNVEGKPFSPHDPNPSSGWKEAEGVRDLYKCFTLSEMHHAQKAGLKIHKVYG